MTAVVSHTQLALPVAGAVERETVFLEASRGGRLTVWDLHRVYVDLVRQHAEEKALAKVPESRPSLPDKEHEVIDRAEAAEILGVNEKLVTRMVLEGGLPGKRIGRVWRFERSKVLAWLAEGHGVEGFKGEGTRR